LEKIRALRGTLTTKIKTSIFFVFGNLLEPINNTASSVAVRNWKASDKTKECYKMLFEAVEEGSEETYMARILKKTWPNEDASTENVAYAIAVAQTILNPGYDKVTILDKDVKKLLARNLVCIYLIISNIVNIIRTKLN
jgi:type III secretory pathway component EscR